MRVAIATRIFSPEPSAASFRLEALAEALTEAGHEVTVLTTKQPKKLKSTDSRPFKIKRFPVLRDKTGYVRGYLQYMSFDVPLLFRLLFSKSFDAIVVEPPPTTGFVVALAGKIKRTPYFYYAADIWSDASEATGTPQLVVKFVRFLEKFAWSKSEKIFAVNSGVASRILELEVGSAITTVGNGVDTKIFSLKGNSHTIHDDGANQQLYMIYTGTASEWQGAEVFVEATSILQGKGTNLRLVFLGQGSAITQLQSLSQELQAPVSFIHTVPPTEAAKWLRGATLAVASIKPGADYDFAFPTKLYAAWATGTQTVYAGPGPAREVLLANPFLGEGVAHDPQAVANAIEKVLQNKSSQTEQIALWAKENVSLRTIAKKVAAEIESACAKK